jgi:hypothetical protein
MRGFSLQRLGPSAKARVLVDRSWNANLGTKPRSVGTSEKQMRSGTSATIAGFYGTQWPRSSAMPSRPVITVAAALLALSSLAGSRNAEGAPIVPHAVQGAILLQIHGCHPYWEKGWSNALHEYLVHRHGRNCRPEPYSGRRYEGHHSGRGRDYDDGDWRGGRNYGGGPPPGWRSYQRAPYGWEQRGCLQVGPLWYCP